MRERLRKVAELPPRLGIPLLCEQAEVAAQGEQAFEQRLRLVHPALQCEVVREPERAGKERAFARRQAVDAADILVVGVAVDEAVAHELTLDRGDRAHHARVVGGRKPTSGIVSRLASSRFEPYDCVNEFSSTSNPFSSTSRWISARVSRHVSAGPARPNRSTAWTPRSNATQAITFECVKWRRGPRTSQMPSSGSFHACSRYRKSWRCKAQASFELSSSWTRA